MEVQKQVEVIVVDEERKSAGGVRSVSGSIQGCAGAHSSSLQSQIPFRVPSSLADPPFSLPLLQKPDSKHGLVCFLSVKFFDSGSPFCITCRGIHKVTLLLPLIFCL
eukprot:TRINITY_DN506_c0_g1_i1.p3 TRINITY_DN506_c0_g1~~TRINITY_DN506_c0_g1_i1.p3  ORF type:complete len:107 (-),score=16.87 TRINITY_DN506_c0_g1_i1:427-747(-)